VFRVGPEVKYGRFEGRDQWVSWLGLVQYYVMIPFAVLGAIRLWRRVPLWPFLTIPLLITATAALTYGTVRFRAPAEVVLVSLAAVGITAAVSWIAGRHARETASSSSLAAG
jgi:hypothetical protein